MSDFSLSTLILGLLFSSIGLGFFIYGKRQNALVPLLCGTLLMIVPYFIGNAWVLLAVGAGLTVTPYFARG